MKKLKIILSVVLFVALFLFLFYIVDATLAFKDNDGILPMADLYLYPKNSIDVLFLGSSHIGVNLDTEQLCNDYGIAAYKLWGPTQPLWNSYHNLVEALKYQRPKVVVLETLALTHAIEYQSYAETVLNISGMRLSINKIKDILVSVPEQYRIDEITGFATYHDRYTQLKPEDFEHYFWNYNFNSEKNVKNWHVIYPAPSPSTTSLREPLGEKEETYFWKIVKLCRREKLPLLLISAPYSIPDEEQARLNTLRDIIQTEQIPYLDYQTNYANIGIDYATDYGDDAGHFNSSGIAKFSSAIGEYLRANYDLPERYGDPYFAYSVPSGAVFALYRSFVGDGLVEFQDTGVKLYSDPSTAWTILARINTQCDSLEKIYFSCFSETPPYRGLLVRGTDNGQLDVILGDNYYCKVDLPKDRASVTLAISKNGSRYNIYLDGKKVYANVETDCSTYNGTLTIGSQWLTNGQLGKLSAVTVEELEVYDKEKNEADILKWMSDHAYVPTAQEMEEYYTRQPVGGIAYELEEEFYGDGQSYINTGVQLYRNPNQDWMLSANLELPKTEADGVYLACFSEDPSNYRGLLVRKSGEELQILLGSGQMLTQRLFGSRDLDLVITKSGNEYEVFISGISIGTVTSACDPYVGPLMIGCELDTNYQPFRQSALTVNHLQITDTIATREEIAAWKWS